MLVHPALTTHLLCRPVSIADSMGPGHELQVLCEAGEMCYVLRPPLLGLACPEWRGPFRFQFAPLATLFGYSKLARSPCAGLRAGLAFFFEHFVQQASQVYSALMGKLRIRAGATNLGKLVRKIERGQHRNAQ